MDNPALDALWREHHLADAAQQALRLQFGLACVQRVAHLLEDEAVRACLQTLQRHLRGEAGAGELAQAAEQAAGLANRHPGSRSIDGCGHAAVSASFAVAHALAGRAQVAAEYAAYASVYGAGGYGAVAERSSFEPEQRWQAEALAALLTRSEAAAHGATR